MGIFRKDRTSNCFFVDFDFKAELYQDLPENWTLPFSEGLAFSIPLIKYWIKHINEVNHIFFDIIDPFAKYQRQ